MAVAGSAQWRMWPSCPWAKAGRGAKTSTTATSNNDILKLILAYDFFRQSNHIAEKKAISSLFQYGMSLKGGRDSNMK
jgi:hypothetical protein